MAVICLLKTDFSWNSGIEGILSIDLPKSLGRVMTKGQKFAVALLLLGIWLLAGCAAVIVGAGVGVGTYTYVTGELKRSYQASYDETLQICIDVINDLGQPIDERTTDGEKTTLRTKRKDGTYQTVDVSIIDAEWTQVSVRTGAFGFWKKDISQQFHEFVAERLKR